MRNSSKSFLDSCSIPTMCSYHVSQTSDGQSGCYKFPITATDTADTFSSTNFYLPVYQSLWDICLGAGYSFTWLMGYSFTWLNHAGLFSEHCVTNLLLYEYQLYNPVSSTQQSLHCHIPLQELSLFSFPMFARLTNVK